MKRKVCVVTGTRAEYGLLRWVMQGIKDDPDLELRTLVTGAHLSPEFGLTYREIEKDDFRIDAKVEMLVCSDTPVGVTKSMGLGLIGFADTLQTLQPDIFVLLGDRFEVFALAAAALVAGIPVVHLHGGETTQGAFDEAFRHSITKMAHLHCVATEEYRQRVIQLGEQPERVLVVGGLGIDNILHLPLLSKSELEKSLDFDLTAPRSLLITFHPVTLEHTSSAQQMVELLAALEALPETQLIFTLANADTGGRILNEMVREFVASHSNARAFASLGQLLYLSCVSHVDGVVGNSSSGLLEVPSFKKPTINIGDRQLGRTQAASVINCTPDRVSISAALKTLYSPAFQETLALVRNPYGDGGASKKVVEAIKGLPLEGLLKKKFYDLPSNPPEA